METLGDSTAAQQEPFAVPGPRLRSGAVVGRYRILEPLGQGGMSEVHAAYDPELDRSVALKVMKHERGHEAHARLQREGRALARLGHRNVVIVHDVGVYRDELFVAMEHVKGVSLSRWVREPGRGWYEILAAFTQAAEALVAAHAAGVIHRDFKPANVMVERGTSRVVVLDFGLARLQGGPTGGSMPSEPASTSGGSSTHSAVGTLGYMAPELMEGDGASEATDQFAFCVSLYEALYGVRPFVGRHAVELLQSIKAGAAPPPHRRGVPSWLHGVVARGLAASPEQRHRSMATLLEQLAPRPAASGRPWLLGAGVVAATGAIAWSFAGPPAGPCADAGHEALASTWNATSRAEARDAIMNSRRGHAGDSADRAIARIDRFAKAWSETAVATCEVRETSPVAQADAVQACLDRGLDRLSVAVSVLRTASNEPEIADRALDLALSLPPVRDCLDEVPLPTAEEDIRDADVSRAIAASVAARVTGSASQAAIEADAAVLASARASPQLQADALLERSRVHDAAARYEPALADATAALSIAVERELPRRQALAGLELVRLTGDRLRRTEEATRWEALTRASVDRLPADPVLHARRDWVLGTIRWRAGELEAAAAHLGAAADAFADAGLEHERSGVLTELSMVSDEHGDHLRARALLGEVLEIRRELYGPRHPAIADTLADMAVVQGRSANTHEALALGAQALALYESGVDPHHPHVATIVMNMGLEHSNGGRHAEALEAFGRAESIRRQHFGDDHVLVAEVLNNQSPSLMALGRLTEARVSLVGTLEIFERAHGPESPSLINVLTNLGNLDVQQGDLDGALGHHTRAHELALAKLGPDHPSVGIGAHNLGDLWVQQGKCSEARPYFERALAIFEASLGPDSPEVAYPLTALGRCATEAGQAEDAVRLLERALKVRIARDVGPADRGQTALALAAARHATEPGSPAAWAAADLALAAFEEAGQAGATMGDDARKWIAETLGERGASGLPDLEAPSVGAG